MSKYPCFGMTAALSCIYVNARTWYIHFFMSDLCHTGHFAFKRLLSAAVVVMKDSTIIPSVTNRCLVVDILFFTSVEIVFSRLSNIRLLGMDTNPQADASLWLY